ncbi:hypothetical protein EsDP_00006324 [Epichloe bromicola]|uniref:Uncharacterized protein n=1 Tax=Epichloe bromicola TaxID=79588 RepID=A0ABQ0CXB2_9HYPO
MAHYYYGRQCSVSSKTAVPTVTVTKYCTPLTDAGQPMTVYSIVHTSTITFHGNLTAYTPPYPPIKTPEYCSSSAPHLNSTSAKGSCSPPCTTPAAPALGLGAPKTPAPTHGQIVVFITTDKNPAVVIAWDGRSSSSQAATDPYPDAFTHESAGAAGDVGTAGPDGIGPATTTIPPDGPTAPNGGPTTTTPPNAEVRRPPTFRVTARGNQVVINGRTFPVGPGLPKVVAVDGGHFTIYPHAVVGEGATIPKPPPAPEGWSVPTPTGGVVGGLDVYLSGTQIVIGGETLTMPLYGTKTVVIRGQTVTLSWDKITVGTSVFAFTPSQPPPESHVVVVGGEMLTAIGKNVVALRGTYMTYGPGVPPRTEYVGGEGVVIAPEGVLVHGIVMGGPAARDNETRLEIVGGVKITEFAPNIALINGRIFTVGPGSPLKTTDIAGQLFTLGPQGVVDALLNLSYPFGEAIVTTIVPTGTWLSDFPRETNRTSDEDNLASHPRSSMSRGGIALCIAIGVLLLT